MLYTIRGAFSALKEPNKAAEAMSKSDKKIEEKNSNLISCPFFRISQSIDDLTPKLKKVLMVVVVSYRKS